MIAPQPTDCQISVLTISVRIKPGSVRKEMRSKWKAVRSWLTRPLPGARKATSKP
ncbi:hypothetical protein D3C71_2227420 [compost metagenome]